MKQRVIILLLSVCMIATLVVGCGNSKNKESEKENINESEVVTEVESEIETEIESEIIETEEVETETNESQDTEVKDTETKVEDTTSSEQKENKPSSDKGQSGSGSTNNTPQKEESSSSSANTWTDGEGNVLSTDPALCSHGGMSRCLPSDGWIREERNIIKYNTGAYDYEEWFVYSYTTCTWCNANMGSYEKFGCNLTNYDNLTDYIGEFKRTGTIDSPSSINYINERRLTSGLEPYSYVIPDNVNNGGGLLVQYNLRLNYDIKSYPYTMYFLGGLSQIPDDVIYSNYSKICCINWRSTTAIILFD